MTHSTSRVPINENESKIVPDISEYRGYPDFMSKHMIKNKDIKNIITNTRIGDSKLAISGGSYNISDAEYSTFITLYYNDIVKNNKKEYLTEKQREKYGPLLIDIDLRHTYETDERQYNEDHISDLIDLYLEELRNIYQMDETTAFKLWIFEKPTVNRVESKNCTKDGIHIIVGLQVDHAVQQILRKRIVNKIDTVWNDISLINTWDDVFDEGISKGTTNWQLYGSRKPGNEAYQLVQYWNVKYDDEDEDFEYTDMLDDEINHMEIFDLILYIVGGHTFDIIFLIYPPLSMNDDLLLLFQIHPLKLPWLEIQLKSPLFLVQDYV